MENLQRDIEILSRRRLFMVTSISSTLFFLGTLSGCSLTGGNKKNSEYSGGPVNDYGLERTTKKLIVKIDNMEFLRQDKKTNPECAICFLGITNSNGEQIPELNEAVRRQFRESTSYRLITDAQIDEAVKKSGTKRNDIYLPEERKKFLAAVDVPLYYFLSGQVFSVPMESAEPGQPVGDQISYDLVSVKDNEQTTIQDRLASIYNESPNKKKGLF